MLQLQCQNFRKTRIITGLVLARIFHESPAATGDMTVLPGVLWCRTLRRTVQVRLGSNPLRLPGGAAIFTVSPHRFVKYPGEVEGRPFSAEKAGKYTTLESLDASGLL